MDGGGKCRDTTAGETDDSMAIIDGEVRIKTFHRKDDSGTSIWGIISWDRSIREKMVAKNGRMRLLCDLKTNNVNNINEMR